MLWNEKYETGNEQVDTEHKEIFALIQKVIDSTTSGEESAFEDTFDFLAGYTVNHFKHEERLMEESSYPHMAVHKKQHDDFVVEVLALRERVLKEADQEKNGAELKKTVVNWVTDHVLGSDKVMASHYRSWLAGQ